MATSALLSRWRSPCELSCGTAPLSLFVSWPLDWSGVGRSHEPRTDRCLVAYLYLRRADHNGERNVPVHPGRCSGIVFRPLECSWLIGDCSDRVPAHLPLCAKSSGEIL